MKNIMYLVAILIACSAYNTVASANESNSVIYKTCVGDSSLYRGVVLLTSSGEFQVQIQPRSFIESNSFDSYCTPTIMNNRIEALQCKGKWGDGSEDTVTLTSADGILNELFFKLPGHKETKNMGCQIYGGNL